MRDVDRIDKVLGSIGIVWKQHPDLRLGQLILNVMSDPALYYVEDDQLVHYLTQYYKDI